MGTIRALAPLALIAALAGCSNTPAAEASTPETVASSIGCSAPTTDATMQQQYVKTFARCSFGGKTYDIEIFADAAARDNWIKVAKQMGGLTGDYKSGPDWVAQPE